ncbi:MAG: translation initiation factor IF-2 [Ruminococcaceae bacterium]|nr:translation initiation factor IF-2 [Oscillospiraceae bacterium]
MAAKPQIKANQLAKDLELKSKDIIDIMSDKGIEIKSQKALEPREFDILFDALTSKYQVEGIDDYIDGITYIPSKLVKEEPKAEEAKAEAPASEKKETEAEKPKSAKPAAKKAETVKEDKKEEPKVEKKEAPAKAADAVAKAEEAPAPQTKVKQEAPATEEQKKPAVNKADRAEAIARAAAIEKAAQQKAQMRADKAQSDRKPAPTHSERPQRPQFEKPQGDRPQFDRPQGDRFAKPAQNDRFQKAPDFSQNRPDKKRDDRKPQKPQGFGGRPGMDKDDYVPSAPKEKFQPQIITRAQSQKGENISKKGAAKTVDIRGSSVDLSKYDEKLDTFVQENDRDLRSGSNQKLKKQQNQNRQESSFKQKGKKGQKPAQKQPPVKQVLNVQIPDEIMVSELAVMLKITVGDLIKRLFMLGMMATANQTIDYDTAAIVADELGANVSKAVVVTIEEKLFDEAEDTEDQLITRAPVVCVMGHVDHGKTSLLDAIRHTSVTSGEAGGITQHIGAYRVKAQGQDITFLDTPGHEAFTAMRARGAQSTDIAILVVAADDGIMPQTVEAINHAKAAGIDIIVAINKMDKPTANPDAVKQELTKYDLVPEEWGGDVICVPVSALRGDGIDELLENVLLVAEVKELKANPNRRAKGLVIEAKLDKGRGPVATVLVQNGTLHNGDIVIAGTAVGRVRAMTDHNGKAQKTAGPSVPVEIIGLAEVPLAGDEFAAVADERMARELADQRKSQAKEEAFKANARANLNDLFAQISDGVKELNIIIKADVGGSAEAVKASLLKLSNDEVKVRVLHSAVGGITEGDVTFAAASNAIIVGFNVRPDKAALDSAERQNVDIRTYRVIYQCIEEIEAAMKGMLAPTFRENLLGHAEVRQTIHVPGVGTIAGSYVLDGKITRAAQIRVVRDGIVIFEDKISSLKRFKDDVKEVAQGYECGIGLDKFNDIKIGDILEAFIMEEVQRD